MDAAQDWRHSGVGDGLGDRRRRARHRAAPTSGSTGCRRSGATSAPQMRAGRRRPGPLVRRRRRGDAHRRPHRDGGMGCAVPGRAADLRRGAARGPRPEGPARVHGLDRRVGAGDVPERRRLREPGVPRARRSRAAARVRARVQRLAHRVVRDRPDARCSRSRRRRSGTSTATVAEIERCAALGHRGILFTGEPQQFGLPLLGDRSWDPAVGASRRRPACRSRSTSAAATSPGRSRPSASPRTASRPRT